MSMGAAVVDLDSKEDEEGDDSKRQHLLDLNDRKQKLLEAPVALTLALESPAYVRMYLRTYVRTYVRTYIRT